MPKANNSNQGRHMMGTPIGKGGIRPPSRTGSPSGYFVGTGVNRKSAARPEMQPRRAARIPLPELCLAIGERELQTRWAVGSCRSRT